jgi:hypothetical protein
MMQDRDRSRADYLSTVLSLGRNLPAGGIR